VEFSHDLPAIRLLPALGIRFPYQILGVGASLEVAPVPWIRASLLYSFGMTMGADGVHGSNYAEGLLGIRLLHVVSEVAVDVPLGQERWFSKRPRIRGAGARRARPSARMRSWPCTLTCSHPRSIPRRKIYGFLTE
jgi:hypothetical protein